jgi:hypothetical protein
MAQGLSSSCDWIPCRQPGANTASAAADAAPLQGGGTPRLRSTKYSAIWPQVGGVRLGRRILVLVPHPAANQKRLMSRGGRKLMGCVSGVASSSSRHIFTVLSASADASREPDLG